MECLTVLRHRAAAMMNDGAASVKQGSDGERGSRLAAAGTGFLEAHAAHRH